MFLTAKWLLRHAGFSGFARVFDYNLYRRTQACLLCMFVLPPTVPLHEGVNSASFLMALSLFIYFRSMSVLSCCRWPESNNVVRSRRFHDFVRSRFTRAHPLESELSYAAKYFLKHNSYRTDCFLKQWICIEYWIWRSTQSTVPISRAA